MPRFAPLVLCGLLVAGCAHEARGRDCGGLTREQCLWQRAHRPDARDSATPGGQRDGGRVVAWESEGSWVRTETMLRQGAQWLSDGLGGEVLSRQASGWCTQDPTIHDAGQVQSWICHLEDPPRIGERAFTLEASTAGILAVTARDFDGARSLEVVELALRRWSTWCVEARFSPVERFQDEEFHSCALPGGPLLLVGRFPQDLEADLWQVSLTVMGAG